MSTTLRIQKVEPTPILEVELTSTKIDLMSIYGIELMHSPLHKLPLKITKFDTDMTNQYMDTLIPFVYTLPGQKYLNTSFFPIQIQWNLRNPTPL